MKNFTPIDWKYNTPVNSNKSNRNNDKWVQHYECCTCYNNFSLPLCIIWQCYGSIYHKLSKSALIKHLKHTTIKLNY